MNKKYEVNFVNEKLGIGETYGSFSNQSKAIAYAKRLLANHGSDAGDCVEVCNATSQYYDVVFRKKWSD